MQCLVYTEFWFIQDLDWFYCTLYNVRVLIVTTCLLIFYYTERLDREMYIFFNFATFYSPIYQGRKVYVLGVSMLPLSTILRLDFRIVQTV